MNIFHKALVGFVKILPTNLVYVFAKPYIAGLKLEDALNAVNELNTQRIMATVDVLGEAISTKDEAIKAKNEFLEVLDGINLQKLDANVSLKPTQMGLLLDEDLCFELVSEIIEKAKSYNNFVRIDMEDSPTTDAIIKLYRRCKKKYDNVGIVVQSYLKRTIKDVEELNAENGHYRLCKGIYIEPEEIAYKDKQKVRDNYLELLEMMFDDGNYVGIATHDEYLVDGAYHLIDELEIDKQDYEFQMLFGVRRKLRDKIVADGHRMRIYVPFGKDWYKYSIRRLQENPNMAWYITKSIFTSK